MESPANPGRFNRKLLVEFGAGRREDVHRGVLPRIESLVRAIAVKASAAPATLEVYRNLSTTMGHSTGLIREQCPVW